MIVCIVVLVLSLKKLDVKHNDRLAVPVSNESIGVSATLGK